MNVLEFSELKKNLKRESTGFPAYKVALLGDSPTQFLSQAIRGYFIENFCVADLWEADYDQIEMQILDPGSEMYQFKPEFIIIFPSVRKLQKKFYGLTRREKDTFSKWQMKSVKHLLSSIENNLSAKIVYLNFPELDDGVFGNYANKYSSSFLYQVRKINLELMELAQERKNLFIVDIAALQNRFGSAQAISNSIYINTGIIFSLDFLPVVAKNISDVVLSIKGKFKKCLVVDLDHTLWGGVIGDDGWENIEIGDLGIGKAYTELQSWIKQLKERGIIIAVCSKNDEIIAKEPFEKHPDMVLKLSDIAVFVANWGNKVDNIRFIQSVLNIGFDSMVFLDDSAFERNMVRGAIPELLVPELPEDPSEYLAYLQTLNLFETASVSEEDENRTRHYQEESNRTIHEKSFANEEEFLASLEMEASVASFNKFNIPRVAQLTQRSNQFNLRTVRYTEEEIMSITDSKDYLTFSFSLKDKFGDYGLISVVILHLRGKDCFIDTWLMSCRVLKRGVEQFVLNTIAGNAEQRGVTKLIGEYIPTPKNNLVEDHYLNLGFTQNDNSWVLNLDSYKEKTCFIKTNNG
jgi:FkbH-like protein